MTVVGVSEAVGREVPVGEGTLVGNSVCCVGVKNGGSVSVGTSSPVEDGWRVDTGEALQPATQSKIRELIHRRTVMVIESFID